MENYQNKIIHGDSLEILRQFSNDSIDCLITDPPYGYSFMGKEWDKAIVSVEIWRECLRVLKPGAFAFIMSAPRQDVLSQMIVCLQQAGFRTDFTSIYWTYASGFPKAGNIGKMIDKRLGAEREVVGHQKITGQALGKNKGLGLVDSEHKTEWDLTKPASEQAKQLNGSYAGFQPKPAIEVILVCMKPLSEKTFVDQALKNGKGVTWLDDARIPIGENDRHEYGVSGDEPSRTGENGIYGNYERIGYEQNHQGRFPANLLVSDDVLNDGRKLISGFSDKNTKGSGWQQTKMGGNKENAYIGDTGSYSRYFDLDKWFEKRFKDLPENVQKVFPFLIVPKASKSEKNKGLEDMPNKIMGQSAKNRVWADKCGNCGLKFMGGEPRCHCPSGEKITSKEDGYQYKNNHPTVKPIKLMSYLITLGSRPNDIILDPFAGSGTTCLATRVLKRKYIGIEISEEYCAIAENRLKVMFQESLF